ncbi:hypothetical protein VP01_1324g2 [Puccinia sorghi]|uniref:Uncharacterized protein n=1 Tax=Puccinia sorghi TaxID=27349 RepID=A0A0L6VN54_9BASI|nr:hypothetical protein VP01_1324g2 [Puccinia sorghi]
MIDMRGYSERQNLIRKLFLIIFWMEHKEINDMQQFSFHKAKPSSSCTQCSSVICHNLHQSPEINLISNSFSTFRMRTFDRWQGLQKQTILSEICMSPFFIVV